jgi:hypothetical protein
MSTTWAGCDQTETPRSYSNCAADTPTRTAPADSAAAARWCSACSRPGRGPRAGRRSPRRAPRRRPVRSTAALREHQPDGHRREHRRADHQHVRRRPHGHVEAVDGVPELVDPVPGDGQRPHGEQAGAPEGHPPAADLPADRGVGAGRDVDADGARHADTGRAEQEVDVRRAEQELVPTDGDVPRDVPEEPGERDQHRAEPDDEGRRRPVGHAGDPTRPGREPQREVPSPTGSVDARTRPAATAAATANGTATYHQSVPNWANASSSSTVQPPMRHEMMTHRSEVDKPSTRRGPRRCVDGSRR